MMRFKRLQGRTQAAKDVRLSGKRASAKSRAKSTRSRQPLRQALLMECLEDRRMMADLGDQAFLGPDDGYVVRRDEPVAVALDITRNDYFQSISALVHSDWRIVILTDAAHGEASLAVDGRTLLYRPDPGFVGIDKVRYGYVNNVGDAVSDPVIVHLSVVDQPWLAVPDWYGVTIDSETELDVLANDIANAKFEGHRLLQLTLQEVHSVEGGTLSISADGRSIHYQPPSAFTGVDTVRYTAIDDDGYTVDGEAQIRVTSAGSSPEFYWPEQVQQLLIQRAIDLNEFGFGYWEISHSGESGGVLRDQVFSASLPDQYEGTNNQFNGIDESDRIKSDGEFLYVLSRPLSRFIPLAGFSPEPPSNLLTVIDVRDPANPTVVARHTFEDRVLAQDLFEDRLTIITGRSGKTIVTVYDVSDPAHMQQVSTTLFSGGFVQARRVEDRLLVVTNDFWGVPERVLHLDEDDLGTGAGVYETGAEYLSRIANDLQATMLPSYQIQGAAGEELSSAGYGDFGQPRWSFLMSQKWPYKFATSLITIDTTSALGGAVDWDVTDFGVNQLLVTHQAVFAATHYADGQGPSGMTTVEKFELHSGGIEFVGAGQIEGSLLDRYFSLDAKGDYLRVATTSTSHGPSVFVLEQQGDRLVQVGAVTNIAPGERMSATRFVNDKAYIATETDGGFFVVDLSNPISPILQGELSDPVYSQYLEMIDSDHLLSIGRQLASETVFVSLIDVSDPSNPLLQDRYELAGGHSVYSSIASPWDSMKYHAFRYFGLPSVLALPIYNRTETTNVGSSTDGPTSAMVTFRIDPQQGIELLDTIDFADSSVNRAARYGEYLYSLSDSELKVSRIDEPNRIVASIDLDAQGSNDFAKTRGGQSVIVDALANDGLHHRAGRQLGRIIDVQVESGAGTVEIIDDGTRVRFTPHTTRAGLHRLRYVIEVGDSEQTSAFIDVRQNANWHNSDAPADVNGDGAISPLDVLVSINLLNRHGAMDVNRLDEVFADAEGVENLAFFDVNGDDKVTPLDILQVINRLNYRRSLPSGVVAVFSNNEQLTDRSTIDFGSLQVGEEHVITLSLRDGREDNAGVSPVLTDLRGNFSIAHSNVDLLAPRGTSELRLKFRPLTAEPFTAELSIGVQKFQLIGRGV